MRTFGISVDISYARGYWGVPGLEPGNKQEIDGFYKDLRNTVTKRIVVSLFS